MRNWKKIAEGFDLNLPDEAIDRSIPVLNRLETVFRPLVAGIPFSTNPAVVYRCPEEPER